MKTTDKVILGGAVGLGLVGLLAHYGKLHLPKWPGAASGANASGVAPPAPRPATAHTPTGSGWKPPAAGTAADPSAPVTPEQIAKNAAAAGATAETQPSDWYDTAGDGAAGGTDGSQFTANVGD